MSGNSSKVNENCWYRIASKAFEGMSTFETEAAFGMVQAYGKGPENLSVDILKKQTIGFSIPNWCNEMVTKMDEAKVYINPSKLLTDKKYKLPVIHH